MIRLIQLRRKILIVAISSLITFPGIASAYFDVGVSVGTAPPPLPVYAQPPCENPGYLWTPGYWAYDEVDGYYWVPGVWVAPPRVGFLWTPGYWGFAGEGYGWHPGYWGSSVGFYGGINYGFGFPGHGFYGGGWEGGRFRYNTAVTNINRTYIHNTYNRTINNYAGSRGGRASFNGPGGINAAATVDEQRVSRENHLAATADQRSHEVSAKRDRGQLASINHGTPKISAMNRINGRHYDPHGRVAAVDEHVKPGLAAGAGDHRAASGQPGVNLTKIEKGQGKPGSATGANRHRDSIATNRGIKAKAHETSSEPRTAQAGAERHNIGGQHSANRQAPTNHQVPARQVSATRRAESHPRASLATHPSSVPHPNHTAESNPAKNAGKKA